jgi:NADH-quinone oxidoreductase subunit L
VTHAFFKALLFLCAGAVIHALHGEQDIRKMGGLRKVLPLTAITFLLAALAISGIPPFSGFFSKDEILAYAFQNDPVLWVLGLLCSGLTTFYVFRVFYLAFSGKFRGDQEAMHHLHKPSSVMTIPLVILAVLSVVGGFIGLPEVFGGGHALQSFLSPVFANNIHPEAVHVSHYTELMLMGIAVAVSVIALVWAMYQYRIRQSIPAPEGTQLNPLHRLAYFKYYVDELYNAIIVKPLYALSNVVYRIGELKVVDGIVELTGKAVLAGGQTLRWIQTGRTVVYMLVMVVAIIILLISTNF